jgi:hypothetical protein
MKNPFIEAVKKWLKDPKSSSLKELYVILSVMVFMTAVQIAMILVLVFA